MTFELGVSKVVHLGEIGAGRLRLLQGEGVAVLPRSQRALFAGATEQNLLAAQAKRGPARSR